MRIRFYGSGDEVGEEFNWGWLFWKRVRDSDPYLAERIKQHLVRMAEDSKLEATSGDYPFGVNDFIEVEV